MPTPQKFWDGKTVHFVHGGLGKIYDSRSYELGLTERTARDLALVLARLNQTTIRLPESVEEILTALNYVLVGDPASVAKHKAMEASKGMEPSGG
jgi:hypothetical protein